MINFLKFFLLIILLYFPLGSALACNNSSIALTNQTSNPNGSITYDFDICVEYGGFDPSFYGYLLVFNSSTSTPVVDVTGSYPTTTTISNASLTSGSLSAILQGLTGSNINSVANDSDWNPFQNSSNVLSFENGDLFSPIFDDICMSIQVTVMGCVEDVDFHANVNSSASSCIYNVSTGQNCCISPNLIINDPSPICFPSTIDLTASSITAGSDPGNLSYWTDAAATNSLINPSSVISGQYYIQLESSGCKTVLAVNAVVNPLPNLVVTDPVPLCSPATIDLTTSSVTSGSDSGNLSYWTDAAASSSLINPSTVSNGIYYIQLEVNGCSSTQPVNAVVNALPNLFVTDPAALCSPATIDLTASSITNGSDPGSLTYWLDISASNSLSNPSAVSSGQYFIQLESSGCSVVEDVNVTINVTPNLIISDPAAICAPSTLDLTVGAVTFGSDIGTLTYWTDPAATNSLISPSNVSNGIYYIQLESNGCNSIQLVNAVVNTLPNLVVTDPAVLCSPATIDLTANSLTNGSDPGTITYWLDVSATNSLSNPSTVSTGTYYLHLDDGICSSIMPVNVSVLANSTGSYNAVICPGGSITYNGTTYDGNNLTGTETLVAANGCDSVVSVSLTVQQSVFGTYNASICEDDSITYNGVLYNSNNLSGSDTLVSAGGCDSIVTVTINLLLNSTATVNSTICSGESFTYNGVVYDSNNLNGIDTIQSASGCDSIVTINVTELPLLTSSFDTTICNGDLFELNGTVYGSGVFSGVEIFTSSTGCDSTVSVSVNEYPEFSSSLDTTIVGAFTFEFNGSTYSENNSTGTELFFSSTGCDSVVNVNVSFENESIFFIPDGFSPNGDGYNDYLYVMGTALQDVEFKIFNRWGELVFETDCCCQESCGWDGYRNGSLVNNGTFVYLFKALDVNGLELTSKGTISLIK